MTAGLPTDVNTLNRTVGQAVVALAQALDTCNGINDMLNNAERAWPPPSEGATDPLVTAGMETADATNLREAFAALALLKQVAYGEIAQSGAQPSNFFFQAQQLMGATPL